MDAQARFRLFTIALTVVVCTLVVFTIPMMRFADVSQDRLTLRLAQERLGRTIMEHRASPVDLRNFPIGGWNQDLVCVCQPPVPVPPPHYRRLH